MFKLNFVFSNSLISNLSVIERTYGQLEALRLPQKSLLNLERENLVTSTYASNRIEGNPLTLPEVTNLLLGDRVASNRDEKEVQNYFKLLQRLPKLQDQPLTIETILDIHASLLEGINSQIAGKIRNEPVVVGKYVTLRGKPKLEIKHNPPHHNRLEITQALSYLLSWLEEDKQTPSIIKTGLFHHQFVFFHPFSDGNGRTTRLLTALVLLKYGYQINKYFVLDDFYDLDREAYSDALSSADEGEQTAWLEYFTQGMRYSLQSALAKAKTTSQTLAIDTRPSPRETQVLAFFTFQRQLTSQQVADHLQLSRQQAFNLLRGLVTKGLIEKKGSTKDSYYQLR